MLTASGRILFFNGLIASVRCNYSFWRTVYNAETMDWSMRGQNTHTFFKKGAFVSKNSYERIISWPYHPQMIIAAGFVCAYAAVMQGDGPIWAALIVAAFAGPLLGFLLFLPYVVSIWILAVLLEAMQSVCKSAQATFHHLNH